MGIVSVGAMAEVSTLKVTSVEHEIEIENTNGNQTFDDVWLFNNVGLEYGDWTIGLQAGKQWSVDFDGQSTHSDNARLQMDIWKKVTPDLKLGTRLRLQDNYDRYYTYEWRDYDYKEQDNRNKYAGVGKENYQDIGIGWNYKF